MPLDQAVIDKVYEDLMPHKDLLQIWTLLDHTGARDSEVRMLLVSEIVIDDPVPHIVIQPRPDRTLKSKWSERKIPLVGAALVIAETLTEGRDGGEYGRPHTHSSKRLNDTPPSWLRTSQTTLRTLKSSN